MPRHFYITTTLPYVNAKPHLGFAAEAVRADIVTRYRKLLGDDVFFNTGTDEHGAKLLESARAVGKDVSDYVNEFAAEFRNLKGMLGLDPDIHFIRTTDLNHVAAAQEFWKRVRDNGYIYKKEYETRYCVGCELEKTDSELLEGQCPLHPKFKIEIIREENYFFRFSGFQRQLLEHYKSHPDFVVPEFRMREIVAFVEAGLQDFSISRLKAKMSWGIPVPDDDAHVMYVWFDALINYISTVGWPVDRATFEKYWCDGTPVQYAGKDNLRQQSAMWQAMLMAADIPLTHTIVICGFVTAEGGVKMSKSLANVIDPQDAIDKYGTETLRLFIAKHIHPFEDSPVTAERIGLAYDADLVNGLGNQVARIMKLAETHLDGPVEISEDALVLSDLFRRALDAFDMNAASNHVWDLIRSADERITSNRPFSLVKSGDPEIRKQGKEMIVDLVRHLAVVAVHLTPIMPETSVKILEAVRSNTMPGSLFPRKS